MTEAQRAYLLDALKGYWPNGDAPVRTLPMPRAATEREYAAPPPLLELVELPAWAADVGVSGALLAPSACIIDGDGSPWQRTDWLAAAFLMLNGAWERAYEARHGPIHSYSFRLHGWDSRLWDHAWVNRIAMFLRRWSAREAQQDEEALCGPMPSARILLTHDVDAVDKTLAIRLKQGAFGAFNSARELLAGRWRESARQACRGLRFLAGQDRYDHLSEMSDLERERGLHATYHFYAGRRDTPMDWLFDPAYNVASLWRRPELARLAEDGHEIGLHPSFGSWGSAATLRAERERLEQACGRPVLSCRQHWLRFSWTDTWVEQEAAGLSFDTTLGFNDRPGFRNAAALQWQPWDAASRHPLRLQATPLLFMDSHFFDYQRLTDDSRRQSLRAWLDEVRDVRGVASVLWHPHTLARDYGWREGFIELLDLLPESQHESATD